MIPSTRGPKPGSLLHSEQSAFVKYKQNSIDKDKEAKSRDVDFQHAQGTPTKDKAQQEQSEPSKEMDQTEKDAEKETTQGNEKDTLSRQEENQIPRNENDKEKIISSTKAKSPQNSPSVISRFQQKNSAKDGNGQTAQNIPEDHHLQNAQKNSAMDRNGQTAQNIAEDHNLQNAQNTLTVRWLTTVQSLEKELATVELAMLLTLPSSLKNRVKCLKDLHRKNNLYSDTVKNEFLSQFKLPWTNPWLQPNFIHLIRAQTGRNVLSTVLFNLRNIFIEEMINLKIDNNDQLGPDHNRMVHRKVFFSLYSVMNKWEFDEIRNQKLGEARNKAISYLTECLSALHSLEDEA
ncbi:hypothetical protein niasHS_016194 [Heterodera schachtii]|uniref:Uncharacterized protein n=1 Tax=Heterodera schachtii TaxID=97005 RepID=A0ABD2HWE7_HETSC